MNDFLSKLLAGLPKAEPQDMGENDPYLDPKILPSPLMSPMQALEKEKLGERVQLRPFEPEQVMALPKGPSNTDKYKPPQTNVGDNVEIPQEPVAAPKTPSLQELLGGLSKEDDGLADAQKRNQDFIRAALMARAANKIGSSIAGVKADEKYGQDFIDLSNKEVTDLQDRTKAKRDARNQAISEMKADIDLKKANFELGDKEKENDPNSELSKAFRQYAKSYIDMSGAKIQIPEGLSYADMNKQMGTLGNIISAKMAQDARRDMMAIKKMETDASKSDKINMKNLDFAERQHDRITKSDAYKKITTAEEQYQSALEALKNPSGVKDIDVLYRTVRGFDPNSAVREGEISLAKQGVSLKQQLELQISRLGNNPRVIPTDFIKQVEQLAEMNKKIAQKQYTRNIAGVLKNAKKRGLSDEDLDLIDPLMNMNQNSTSSTNQDDPRIDAFMKKNNIKDRNEAIKILKDAGKL